MGDLRWIAENWFVALNAVGVVGGLFFTAISFRSETHTRKVANLLTITRSHRELWLTLLYRPDLGRVLDPVVDLRKKPITREEEIFAKLLILHVSSVFYATKEELVVKVEGLRRDVSSAFSLPIPRAIWEKMKPLQNNDFVEFVESSLSWK